MTRTVMARTVLPLLAALAALLLAAGPASAHDVVTGSDPTGGASLAGPPAQVSVTFDEAPQPAFSTLTVVGPGGTRWEQGTATTEGDRVSIGVNRLGPAGDYEIGYRIVSSDGHPVAGSVAFTLTAPAGGTANDAAPAAGTAAAPGQAPTAQAAGQPATPPSPAAASGPAAEGGVPAWPFVGLAVVVIAGALVLVLRRRSS